MSIDIRTLTYAVDQFTLGKIDLSINAGEHVHIKGPNGSGKSLLLELICGLRTPHTGSIHIDGQDATHLPPNARGLGYVPQHGGLFSSMTVAKQVVFPLTVRQHTPESVQAKLNDISKQTRIQHLLNRKPSQLSGGERQRVALARALIHRPSTVLLDEPTSALDENSKKQVDELLNTISKQTGITIIHVRHDRDQMDDASHRNLYMLDGKIS